MEGLGPRASAAPKFDWMPVGVLMTSGIARRGRFRWPSVTFLVVLSGSVLGGCSLNSGVSQFIIDPGHYSVYHCKDLAARLSALQGRQKELSDLMDKAGEGGAGGKMIANLSYRADYENAVGEEKVLRRAAAEKNCDLPPPTTAAMVPAAPPPAASTPAAYASPPAAAPPTTATGPVFQSDQTIH
jgi:hypothetical protein